MPQASKKALAIVVILYAIAWLLPVVDGGTTLAKGGLPGWEAFRVALSPLWESGARDTWWESALSVASGLTNAWFIGAVAVLWRSPTSGRTVTWGSLAATVLNSHWWLLYQPRSDLRIGYYIWWISFAAIAGAGIPRSRETAFKVAS